MEGLVNRQLLEGRTPTVRPFHAMSYEVDHRWLRALTEVTPFQRERFQRQHCTLLIQKDVLPNALCQ